MHWLVPALISTLCVTAIMTVVYFFLYAQHRKRYLASWSWGWALYCGRLVFELLLLNHKSPALLVLNQYLALFSGFMLLVGTYQFIEKQVPRWWYGAIALNLVWIAWAITGGHSFMMLAIPTFVMGGIIYCWAGLALSLNRGFKSSWKYLTGGAFLLWGIHKLNYPFLKNIPEIAPIGYLVAALLGLVVAIGMIMIFHEMTVIELRNNEQQLRQAQKMEAVGQLAGGIAHDFNNLLSVVIGNASMLQMECRDEHQQQLLEQILSAAKRGAGLTRSLLSYSRKQVMDMRQHDLNTLVSEFIPLLRGALSSKIVLNTKLHPAMLLIRADRNQIEQVLMNLVVNARDAIKEGGNICIATESGPCCSDDCRIEDGRLYAKLIVTDSGCGMDETIRSRIFDPFFTTKEIGKGTGLGLAVAFGIVKQHGGTISAHSSVGKGAEFIVCLPLDEQA